MASPSVIAVDLAINEIKARIIEEAERRGKVATRGTINYMTTSAMRVSDGAVGRLEMNENWKWWGNGRGPGGMPPIENIRTWIAAKGVEASPWAIAKTIAQQGTKDYRLRAPNIPMSAVDDFESGGGMDRLEAVAGKELEDGAAILFTRNLNARG